MAEPYVSPVVVARVAATAAREVAEVVDLHGGALGEVATYGEGGVVRGVRIKRPPHPRVRLHLAVRFGARLDAVAEEVRRRVAAALTQHVPSFAGTTIDVHIVDVRQAGDHEAQGDGAALPPGESIEDRP